MRPPYHFQIFISLSELDNLSKMSTSEDKIDSVIEAFAALLETFREARRREFKANFKAVDSLKEMGFDEEQAKEALRITGNNQASAVSLRDWALRNLKNCLLIAVSSVC